MIEHHHPEVRVHFWGWFTFMIWDLFDSDPGANHRIAVFLENQQAEAHVECGCEVDGDAGPVE